MIEHAVRMGPWRSSVGVVTLPDRASGSDGERAPTGAPTVVFLNAGLLHHAGPQRLHVHLARRLARSGLTSLRFDLSGIGDSGVRQDTMGRQESIVQETREALDHMAGSYGSETFVLFGICAGADQAVRAALEDERVVGVILVDGYAYRTTGNLLHHYADRVLRPRSWWNVLSLQHPGYARLASRLRGSSAAGPTEQPTPGPRLGVYQRPTRDEAEQRLRRLALRGCRLFCAYTPSVRFNRRTQFGEMFPSLADSENVRVEYFEHANHLFTLLASQEALGRQLDSWMAEAVRSGSPPVRTT